jgi:hypothetical protein
VRPRLRGRVFFFYRLSEGQTETPVHHHDSCSGRFGKRDFVSARRGGATPPRSV